MDEYESLSHTRWECLGSQVRELRAFRPFRCLKCGIFGSGERFAHDLLHHKIDNSRYPLPRPKRIYVVIRVVPLQSAPIRPSVPDSHAARRARSASQPSKSAPALHLFRAPAIGKDSIRRGRSNLAILCLSASKASDDIAFATAHPPPDERRSPGCHRQSSAAVSRRLR